MRTIAEIKAEIADVSTLRKRGVRSNAWCDYETRYLEEELSAALTDSIPLDRLEEICKAEREGRCMVLPCKVGDAVYRIGASVCKWRAIDHCDEYCDGWQYRYRDCWEGTSAVLEEKFSIDDLSLIGKTVFLTCEAAEAALKGANEHDT